MGKLVVGIISAHEPPSGWGRGEAESDNSEGVLDGACTTRQVRREVGLRTTPN